MAWIALQRVPLLASGLAMLLLAVVLLRIDFAKRVNRAFAAFLALRGLTLALGSLSLGLAGDRAVQAFAPYLRLAIVPVLLYFASLYPRRRGPLARPGMGWAVLALVLALDGTYFAWHDGFYTVSSGPAPTPVQTATPDLFYAAFGPLVTIGFLLTPLAAALGVLFARDYTRSPAGPQRTSYFLVAAGFLLNGLFDGTQQLVGLGRLLAGDPSAFPWSPWGWAFAALPSLAVVPAVAGLVLVGTHHFRGRAAERRREARRERLLFGLASLAVLTGLSTLILPAGSEFFDHPLTLVVLGLWRLSLPAFVTYALLRYALFDIDVKVRAAVAWAFVLTVVGVTYFVVGELLSNLVQDRVGTLGGILAAGLLTLAGERLSRLGKRVARAIMPGVQDLDRVVPKVADGIYQQQFLMLQEDGVLTAKERRSLEDLRLRLGLDGKRAATLERQALRLPAGRRAGLATSGAG